MAAEETEEAVQTVDQAKHGQIDDHDDEHRGGHSADVPPAATAKDPEIKAKEEVLIKKAYEVRDMPDGRSKDRAKEVLINAAKEVEQADQADKKYKALKSEEKELINEAYKVRDMPEGGHKEQRKTELINEAKDLERQQAAAKGVKDEETEQAAEETEEAVQAVEAAKHGRIEHDADGYNDPSVNHDGDEDDGDADGYSEPSVNHDGDER